MDAAVWRFTLVLAVVSFHPVAEAQLDPTFGTGGQVTTDVLGPSDDVANRVVIQDDGRIVVAGSARPSDLGPGDFVVARYHPDGSLDLGFGQDGRARADFQSGSDRATDVAIQEDGKIIVIGSASISDDPGVAASLGFGLVRYQVDGNPDPNFGDGGKVAFSLNFSISFIPMEPAVAIQADGKIVVAGTLGRFEPITFNDYIAVARFQANGDLDLTFGDSGLVTTDTGRRDVVHDVVIQSDGRILVVGSSNETDSADSDFRLIRYLPDGTLDLSFGTSVAGGGVVRTDFAMEDDVAEAVVLQPDGRIVVAGSSGGDFALAVYLADGTLDGSFGTAGRVATDLGSADESANGVALEPGGRIIAAGSSGGDFALAAYLANGTLDGSFGAAGIVTTDLTADADDGRDVALQPDGRIVVVGTAPGTAGGDFAVARYLADGALDPDFAGGFVLTEVLGSTDNPAHDVALQPDGRIVVAGAVGSALALARYDADGGLEDTFGDGGVVVTGIGAGPQPSLALDLTGAIVAAGVLGDGFAVVRYFPDGTPDTSFGSGGVAVTGFPSNFPDQPQFFRQGSVRDVSIQADGKIVVAGDERSCFEIFCTAAFALARYHADGSPDVGFGDSGLVLTFGRTGRALVIQPDGKIVVAGSTASPIGGIPVGFALARYEPDGSPDLGFGESGTLTTNFEAGSAFGESLAIQADGRIVVAGTGPGPGFADFALVRYLPDGSLDESFGDLGTVLTDLGSASDHARSVVIQPDGRLVVAGSSGDPFPDEDDFVVAVYKSDGSLDAGFGTDGVVTTDFGADDSANGVALQLDGKIVAVGGTAARRRADFALARYDAPGPAESGLCGDVDNNGIIDPSDLLTFRQSLADPNGSALSPAGQRNCTLIGEARACDILDVVVLARELELPSLSPGIAAVCEAALGP